MITIPTQKALKLFVALSRAYQAVETADRKDIAQYGLSRSEFAVLELLHHKGRQPIQQIAAKVLLTSGSMTYVVGQLVKKGYVARVTSQQDARIAFVALTQAGEALITQIFPIHAKFLSELFDALPESDIENLTQTLKALGKSVQEKNRLN